LSKSSEHYKIKRLERDLYLGIILPYLKRFKKPLVLDAAGGIGRFALEIAKMGHKVFMVDASITNLRKALKHLKKNRLLKGVSLYWGDVSDLSAFADGTFDVTLSIETICYCSNAEKALRELARVTKKNGLIVVSVEDRHGSMLSDANITLKRFSSVYFRNELRIKDSVFTRYYTKKEFESLLRKCGIKILSIQGCNYVPNGIFHRFAENNRLANKAVRKRIFEVEKLCRKDKFLKDFPRVWVCVGRVGK